MWDETAMWSQRLERFLKHGDRATQLQAMEARGSPFVLGRRGEGGLGGGPEARQQGRLELLEGFTVVPKEEETMDRQSVCGTLPDNSRVQGS